MRDRCAYVCGNAVRQSAISYLEVVTAKLLCVVHDSGARRAIGNGQAAG
jgi:hypothetical protein